MKKLIFTIQAIIQFFVGVSAAVSGALMMIIPSGALFQLPPDMLKNTPFHDFLIPGIILFFINGVGQIVAGFLSMRKHPKAGFTGAVFGMGLMIWIFVQVNMIGGGHILQYSYFMLGLLETALSFLIQNYLAKEQGFGLPSSEG
jgi:hypothetical protein